MNENMYHVKSNANYSNKLYAIMNTETNRLETKLTNPGHKFWEVKGHCKNALNKYTDKYNKNVAKYQMLNLPHPDLLKVVEFKLLINDIDI
jgi:hypothetical protein